MTYTFGVTTTMSICNLDEGSICILFFNRYSMHTEQITVVFPGVFVKAVTEFSKEEVKTSRRPFQKEAVMVEDILGRGRFD